MRREKITTLSERDIILGLILSDSFCREVAPVLNPKLLKVDYARIIAGWVKEFYHNFKQNPGKDILKLYRTKIDTIKDEELQFNILTFLERLDKDSESINNSDFHIQEAIRYLKKRSMQELCEDLSSYIDMGEIEEAENVFTRFKMVEKSTGEAVSILHNTEALTNSYIQDDELLFEFPGAYGKVIGKVHREDFIAYLAPMKRGKTFALIDAGITAVQKGLKVVHVSLEMSEHQVIRRYWTALSGQIQEEKSDIDYSYFAKSDDKWKVSHKTIHRKAVTTNRMKEKQKSLKRLFRGGDIRVLAVPAYSLTVEALELKLEKLAQQEDFIPDIVIVDYADIMSPSERGDYRNQLDGIWKRLRSIAQSRRIALFTASQSGRASLDKDADSKDIAEDIRKLAHITSMVALNQTPDERTDGILRLKQLAVREGKEEYRQAICTQCLEIGRIVTDSRFEDEVIGLKKSKESEDEDEEEKPKNKRKSDKYSRT